MSGSLTPTIEGVLQKEIVALETKWEATTAKLAESVGIVDGGRWERGGRRRGGGGVGVYAAEIFERRHDALARGAESVPHLIRHRVCVHRV